MSRYKQIRLKNLRILIREAGSARALADLVETNPAYLSQLVSNTQTPKGSLRGVGDNMAARLERAMKKRPGWMDTDHAAGDARIANHNNIVAVQKISNLLPLLEPSEVIGWRQIMDRLSRGSDNSIQMIRVAEKGGPNAFCMRVQGDMMLASEGPISFPDGIIIQIDPDIAPRDKSFVVAKNTSTNEVTFKQYVTDGSKKFLKPLNLRYPITELNDDISVIGVVYAALLRIPV